MPSLFPFHPRLVHFPIALGLVGVVFVTWGLVRGRPTWTGYGRMSLLIAWLGVLAAALTGLIDQSRAPATPVVTNTINLHITVGVALIVVFGLALYWPVRDRELLANSQKRWAYLALLLVGAILIVVEAWLGGQLVYRLGVGVAVQ